MNMIISLYVEKDVTIAEMVLKALLGEENTGE